jgi:DNA-binding NarL/FixJ family response regulator
VTGSRSARILIVDDFPGWRARVREILGVHPEWKIISEAADGEEAVRRASELQPDIVILDLGLPGLNGIEVGKMIRQTSPRSKIVFLTQNTDSDIRKAALNIGQTAFVTKTMAAAQLCDAVTALLLVG